MSSPTGKRAAHSAQPHVIASARAVIPEIERAIDTELDARGLVGAEREAMKAAIVAVIPGILTDAVGRPAAIRHELLFEGSKNRSHEALGELLGGLTRQSIVSKYRLGPDADELRAELRAEGGDTASEG